MKHYLPRLLTVLALAALATILGAFGPIRILDVRLNDSFQNLKPKLAPSEAILLITIDDNDEKAFLRKYGTYGPTWRKLHAKLLGQRSIREAAVIGFDLFFEGSTQYDGELTKALQTIPTSVIAYQDRSMIPQTILKATHSGYATFREDRDRVVRRFVAATTVHEPTSPVTGPYVSVCHELSLALRVVALYRGERLDRAPCVPGLRQLGNAIEIRATLYPADLSVPINYSIDPGRFNRVPYREAVQGNLPTRLTGKIVLIGNVMRTVGDQHETPLGRVSGAELNALAIETLLGTHTRSIWVSGWATWILVSSLYLGVSRLTRATLGARASGLMALVPIVMTVLLAAIRPYYLPILPVVLMVLAYWPLKGYLAAPPSGTAEGSTQTLVLSSGVGWLVLGVALALWVATGQKGLLPALLLLAMDFALNRISVGRGSPS